MPKNCVNLKKIKKSTRAGGSTSSPTLTSGGCAPFPYSLSYFHSLL